MTSPDLFIASDPPSLDGAIACQSDRWAQTSSEPWRIEEMVNALWARWAPSYPDRLAFETAVREAVGRLERVGRVKAWR